MSYRCLCYVIGVCVIGVLCYRCLSLTYNDLSVLGMAHPNDLVVSSDLANSSGPSPYRLFDETRSSRKCT